MEKYLRRIFDIGVIIKGIDGVLEVLGGIALIFVSADAINRLVAWLVHFELAEDPHDRITNFFLGVSHLSASSERFAIFFLLAHGLVKVAIVWGLLKNKLWAYPVGIAVFSGFWLYEAYRYFQAHSPALLILGVIDLLVIFLTWHEYRLRKETPIK
ncbi:MAG: DUF2127 domain-containing protein [Candidatus Saccharibacteria bacterium]